MYYARLDYSKICPVSCQVWTSIPPKSGQIVPAWLPILHYVIIALLYAALQISESSSLYRILILRKYPKWIPLWISSTNTLLLSQQYALIFPMCSSKTHSKAWRAGPHNVWSECPDYLVKKNSEWLKMWTSPFSSAILAWYVWNLLCKKARWKIKVSSSPTRCSWSIERRLPINIIICFASFKLHRQRTHERPLQHISKFQKWFGPAFVPYFWWYLSWWYYKSSDTAEICWAGRDPQVYGTYLQAHMAI